MLLDLDNLERTARDLGFDSSRRSTHVLDVTLSEAAILSFKNFSEDNDNTFGFETTPWHTHDDLYWASSDGENFKFSPNEVLLGIACGELIVAARYVAGDLKDMWIDHVRGLGEFEFYEAGEELRAWRIG